MSFLAPWFLLGGLALALPIVYHLVRRTTREHTAFSSLMFLRPAPPRLTRRNRLEHLLLLLLRCAAIGLLALGFARPFFKQPASSPPLAATAKRFVVLVDTSASMRRGNLWESALERVDDLLRAAAVTDQVAILTFDRHPTTLLSFEEWSAALPGDRVGLARSRLAASAPGWGGTQLDQALIQGSELLAEIEEGRADDAVRRVVVVSDLQSGSRWERLQAHEWPDGIEIAVEPLTPRTTSNAGLHLAAEAADATPAAPNGVRLRVTNEPDSRSEQFEVGWSRDGAKFLEPPLSVYVPAGQKRIVTLPVPEAPGGADRILLRGDEEVFDNTLFVVPSEPARVSVAYLGKEAASDTREPRYFLERALQESRRLLVELVTPSATAPLTAEQADASSLFVVTDPLTAGEADRLRTRIEQGKAVLLAPRDATAALSFQSWPELGGLTAEEATFPNYGLLGELDFRHPLFLPFADPRFSDFTKIHFWKYRRLEVAALPEARVLARFDNEDPALIEVTVGKGRLWLLASGWHPADSQLALSSKFVPLLYSFLDLSGAGQAVPTAYLVGDAIPLPARSGQHRSAGMVLGPEGQVAAVAAEDGLYRQTGLPGIYAIRTDAATNRFAVNLDPLESSTAPLPADEFERLGAPVARTQSSSQAQAVRETRLHSAELEARQKLWRWVILATLGILLFETWLAGRTARQAATTVEATS